MRGAQFSWFKIDVIPVVAAVGIGMGCMFYSVGRNLMHSPDVRLTKESRMEGVPENGTTEIRAAEYNKGSMYKHLQGARSSQTVAEGRTRIFPHSS